MKSIKVLVVDDEPLVRRSTKRLLTDQGYEVLTAATATEGQKAFEDARPQIVLLDVRLPDGSGLDILPKLRKIDPSVQVVIVTAVGEPKDIVLAMKQGATDYLKKPYELSELLHAVQSAGRIIEREKQLKVYRKRERANYAQSQMIGGCSAMQQVKELVRKVARSDATNVLITGESGTGKELVARAIHFESARRSEPLMELNCSGFQETLLENELFGHERGAFTGANFLKRGLVELCDGGTLLLDEVGEMPLTVQAILLRFLDKPPFRRGGGNVDVSVDIRVLAATNANLEQRIAEGEFRRDLYYRLKVVWIQLPPLRDRGQDILNLAHEFLMRFNRQFRKQFGQVSPEAAKALLHYPWPGNVRELENLLERVVLLEDGPELELRHLPVSMSSGAATSAANGIHLPDSGADPAERGGGSTNSVNLSVPRLGDSYPTLRDVGDGYIRHILASCDDNRTRAARVLGLSRQGLIDRLRRMEEEPADKRAASSRPSDTIAF